MRLLRYLFFLLPFTSFAQTDSVIVSGQIKHLSARLYRQSPNVVIARTNMVRGGSEQAFLAPLQPDGRFRVAVPVIYPLEEMTLQLGGGDRSATVAFLATAGSLTVDADNDSLFVATVPFRFGGVNAQVNRQHAQYEAVVNARQKANKGERDRAIRRAMSATSLAQTYQQLVAIFLTPFEPFATQREVFPLVRDWIRTNAQYDAAAFVYDQAINAGQTVPSDLYKTMMAASNTILTPARANAFNRLGAYAAGRISQEGSNRAVRIQLLASLLSKYGRNLTADDQERLATMRETGAAKTAEVRYLSRLMERNPDTLNRLLLFEQSIQSARPKFDSATVDYLKAYLLTSAIPQATLQLVHFLGDYIRPQIGDPLVRQSFREVISQALADTAQVRLARTQYRAIEKRTGVNYGPVTDGIYVTTGTFRGGDELFKNAIDRNRGKAIYVVMWSPLQENGRQLARDAQRLLEAFDSRDLAILYLAMGDIDEDVWLESIVRNRLRGDHLRLSDTQSNALVGTLTLYDENPVRLITPQGRVYKRAALLPTPDDFPKLIDQINDVLK
ncbi:hypothetical protein ACAW74_27115 [Fibrella sp. WM1]|uniref:hypothetical protein n=1 Tax=Fibrella musci TaxID=3242485 RepID=UPI0035226082